MHAATIVPQQHLHLIAWQPYHLALAHLIKADGFNKYTQFYKDMATKADKYVIMDNGLIEGDPRPLEELVTKALWLGADELVLPDTFRDGSATYRQLWESLEWLRQNDLLGRIKTMAVVQGSTFEEWVHYAEKTMTLGVDVIGVPKVLSQLPAEKEENQPFTGMHARYHALRILRDQLVKNKKEIHLLGCWDSPLEIKQCAAGVTLGDLPEIRGVDSAIAFVYAEQGMKMSEGERPQGKIDFDSRTLDPDDLTLKYNIAMWQAECKHIDPYDPNNSVPRFF